MLSTSTTRQASLSAGVVGYPSQMASSSPPVSQPTPGSPPPQVQSKPVMTPPPSELVSAATVAPPQPKSAVAPPAPQSAPERPTTPSQSKPAATTLSNRSALAPATRQPAPPVRAAQPALLAEAVAESTQTKAETEADESSAADQAYTTVAISHKSDKIVRKTSVNQPAVPTIAAPEQDSAKPLREHDYFDHLDKQFGDGLVSLVSLLYKINHNPDIQDTLYKYLLEASAKASPLADEPQVEVAGKDYRQACKDPIYNSIAAPVAQAKHDFLNQVATLLEPDLDEEAQSHLMEFNQVEDEDSSSGKQRATSAIAKDEMAKAKAVLNNLVYEIDGKDAVAVSANKSLGQRTAWHKLAGRYIREEILAKRIKQDSLLGISELVPVKDLCVSFFEARATLHDSLASLYDDKSLNPNIPLAELERRVARRLGAHKPKNS